MIKYKVSTGLGSIEFITQIDADTFAAQVNGSVEQVSEEPVIQSQKEKDLIRFSKRAAAKDQIIAEMAAENIERVRNGIWTVAQLISLTSDTQLKDLLADVNTLSFEIAYSRVDGLTNSLITSDIKAAWKTKLYNNFFL